MPYILLMLIKLEEEEECFYLCSCSDWSTIVLAKNHNQAASIAVKFVIDELGQEGTNISAALRVKKIKEELENNDFLLRMDEILSDIGLYKESKALKEIFNNDRD